MGDSSYHGGHDDTRDGGKSVGDAHQGSSEWRSDVDVIRQITRIHPPDEHGAQGEQDHSQFGVATNIRHHQKADGRGYRSCRAVMRSQLRIMLLKKGYEQIK